MQVNEEMLQAALKKAVEVGLVPRFLIGEESYIRNWEAVQAIIQAALDAAPNG